MEIAAIPTTYKGINFRSRLEARWAAFFDLIGWRWEYEPLDLNGWIPDFVLLGEEKVLVEIRPYFTFADWQKSEQLQKIDRAMVDKDVLLLNATAFPDPIPGDSDEPFGYLHDSSGWAGSMDGDWTNAKFTANFSPERDKTLYDFSSVEGSWTGRMEGEHPKGHCPHVFSFREPDQYRAFCCKWMDGTPRLLEMFWNKAGNQVQWKGRYG